jgi:hypothetical protein
MSGMIGKFSYSEIAFNADGSLDETTGDGADGLAGALAHDGARDLFVFAHGWNVDYASARDLYQWMFSTLSDLLGDNADGCAAMGVLWPSLLFPDDQPSAAPAAPSSGAELAKALAPAFASPQQQNLDTIGSLLDNQPEDPDDLTRFHDLARSLVTTPGPPDGSEDANLQAALTGNTMALLTQAAALALPNHASAEGIDNPFDSLWKGGREVLRAFSYYEMKNRAGVIGAQGLGPLLATLAGSDPALNIYLMGHSFGARLVASSLAGLPDNATGAASQIKTLYLIQGAFSHFAFASPMPVDASRSGLLAQYASRVDGPFLATFTRADRAVGTWYPTASFLQRQDDEDVHDFMFRWEGLGHDGYQQDGTTTITMLEPGQPYDFTARGFYNLDANSVICADQNPFSGAHSDIRHPEVLWPLAHEAKSRRVPE